MPRLTDTLRWYQPSLIRRARRSLLETRVLFRRRTAVRRARPTLLILGAQRSGTTSLYNYLVAHPSIVPPLGKELQYFSTFYERGPSWYRAHFPLETALETRGSTTGEPGVTLEGTPYYLFHPLAARRVASELPEAKLVVLLRDPTARAFSHYLHSVQRRVEPLSFEDALAAEPQRLAGEVDRIVADPRYQSDAHRAYSYFSRGLYVDQLSEWMAHFPRHQFLVLASEDLYRVPSVVYRQVLDFIGLRAWEPSNFGIFASNAPSREGLAPETRAALNRRYAPHNERLAEFLGRDFAWSS